MKLCCVCCVVLCYEVMLADGADRAGGVEVGWRITLPEERAEQKLGGERDGERLLG